MNNFTLALYMIDMISNLNGILIVIVVISAVAALAYRADPFPGTKKEITERNIKISNRLFVACIICTSVIVVLPSERTMTLMVASEIGSEMLDNKDFKELYDLTITRIKDELKNNRK